MNINFEPNFQKRVLCQTFTEPTTINTKKDCLLWRKQWMDSLSSWHSPYKALIDCRNLNIADDALIEAELNKMITFFKGFFLKNALGFGFSEEKGHAQLPFEVLESEAEARGKIGLDKAASREAVDYRSSIQVQNDFREHVIELSFDPAVEITERKQVTILKDKLTNNLMQWHSAWNLLIDCSQLEVNPETHPDFERMFKFFGGFFMKNVIGYAPKGKKEDYPFKVYRSRHKAVAQLESEGTLDAAEANCASRKSP